MMTAWVHIGHPDAFHEKYARIERTIAVTVKFVSDFDSYESRKDFGGRLASLNQV